MIAMQTAAEGRTRQVAEQLAGVPTVAHVRTLMRLTGMPDGAAWRYLWLRRATPTHLAGKLGLPVRGALAELHDISMEAAGGWEHLVERYHAEIFGREPAAGALAQPNGMQLMHLRIEGADGERRPAAAVQVWWQAVRHPEASGGLVAVRWHPERPPALTADWPWDMPTRERLPAALTILNRLPLEARIDRRGPGRPKGQGKWPDAQAFAQDAIGFIQDRAARRKSYSKEEFAHRVGCSVGTVTNWCDRLGSDWPALEREALGG